MPFVLMLGALGAACADEDVLSDVDQSVDVGFNEPHDPHNVPMDRIVGAVVCQSPALGGACQRIIGVSPDLQGEDWTATKTPMRDTISSIQLAPGYEATLCTGIGLNGTCQTFTRNSAGAGAGAHSNLAVAVDNRVRSFDVRLAGHAPAKVMVCYGALARQCAAIRSSILDLAGQTFPNGASIDDTIQSWVLAPGVKAKVCELRAFGGACTEHEQPSDRPPFELIHGAPIDMDWTISSIDITSIGASFAAVHACRDRDLRGYCTPFASSHPDLALLRWPDGTSMAASVSSLWVAPRTRASACSGRLSGTCRVLRGTWNLADQALDDRLTSIEVVPDGLEPSGAIACTNRDLGGDCRSLFDHDTLNLSVTPWGERSWDNVLSSVALAPQRAVRLCDGRGLAGPCTTIPAAAGAQSVNLGAAIDNRTTSFTVRQDALFVCQDPDFVGPCRSFAAGDARMSFSDLRWSTGGTIDFAGGGISSIAVMAGHDVQLCTAGRLGGDCRPFEGGALGTQHSLAGDALDNRIASFTFGAFLDAPRVHVCKNADLTGPCRGFHHSRLELTGTFADGSSIATAQSLRAGSRIRVCPAIRLGGACRELAATATARVADLFAGPARSFEVLLGTPGHLFVCRSADARGPCVAAGEPTSEWGVSPRPAWSEVDGYVTTGDHGIVATTAGSLFVAAGFRGVGCAGDAFAAPCTTVLGAAAANLPPNTGVRSAEVRRVIARGQPAAHAPFPAGSATRWSEGTQGVAHDADSWYFTSIETEYGNPGLPYVHKVALRDVGTDRGRITRALPSFWDNYYAPICRHVGDPAFHGGRLFLPVDDCEDGDGARLFVYNSNLVYLGAYLLEGLDQASWVAIDPQTGRAVVPRNATTLAVFEAPGPLANGITRVLAADYDVALELPPGMNRFSWTQGGEFSSSGKLYIVNENLERVDGGDDFRFFADPGIFVYQLAGPRAVFDQFIPVPNYDPEWDGTSNRFAELEGITLWDLPVMNVDGGTLRGQIHYVLLENCGAPAVCGSDESFLHHVSLPAGTL